MNFATNPLKLTMKLVRQRNSLFIISSVYFLLIHSLPVLTGVFMGGLFDVLSGAEGAGLGPWTFLALALATDVSRIFLLIGGIRTWVSYYMELTLHLRNSVLGYLLTAAGSRRLPDSPSESVTRFRDDVNDIGEYVENWVDFWGAAAYAVVALSIMLSVNAVMTLVACVPLVVMLLLSNVLMPQIRGARRRTLECGQQKQPDHVAAGHGQGVGRIVLRRRLCERDRRRFGVHLRRRHSSDPRPGSPSISPTICLLEPADKDVLTGDTEIPPPSLAPCPPPPASASPLSFFSSASPSGPSAHTASRTGLRRRAGSTTGRRPASIISFTDWRSLSSPSSRGGRWGTTGSSPESSSSPAASTPSPSPT